MASHDRFGFEWDKYNSIEPQYEDQFRIWVSPLGEKDFKGKAVLDAGCGMGRNSYWALKWGARSVTAFDYGADSVRAAETNLAPYPEARVIHRSIYDIDFSSEFDIAMSIGVIHHLEDPKKALANMVRALRPDGQLVVWVYSYEGWGKWVVRFLNPLRKGLTAWLPISFTHALSYLITAPLWVFLKIFRGPGGLFRQFSTFPFWHLQSIVFDHLLPEIANYWTKEEVAGLVRDLPLHDVRVIRPSHDWGWTLVARKK